MAENIRSYKVLQFRGTDSDLSEFLNAKLEEGWETISTMFISSLMNPHTKDVLPQSDWAACFRKVK